MRRQNNLISTAIAMAAACAGGAATAEPAFVAAPAQAPGGDRTHYTDPTLDPGLPFSAAVVVGDVIHLAGQLGVDRVNGRALVAGGAGAETTQIFKNYEALLRTLDADLSDLVKCTVFLADMADYGAMNAAYAAALPSPKPARTTVAVKGLALDAALEIECLAVRRKAREQAGKK